MTHNIYRIRQALIFFMACLVISGVTAIPVEPQLQALIQIAPQQSPFYNWVTTVLSGYRETREAFPFLLYGYDWLAFAHLVLAILFIGPYRDPVKNKWVIEFGMISCVLVFPLAFIAGPLRGIPLGWQLIDCCFGALGLIPLWYCHKKIRAIEISLITQTK
jgi:hypothetical protein